MPGSDEACAVLLCNLVLIVSRLRLDSADRVMTCHVRSEFCMFLAAGYTICLRALLDHQNQAADF